MSTTQTTMATNEDKDKDKMTQEEKTRYFIGTLLILLIVGLILYLIFKPKSTDITSSTSSGPFALTSTPLATGNVAGKL